MNIENEIKNAHIAFTKKQYLDAANLFESISAHLFEAKDLHNSAEMRNNASVAFLLGGNAQKAFDLAKDTHLVFERFNDWKNYGMALGNQASAAEGLGEKTLALDLYQQASEILKKAGEEESRAYVLKKISSLQIQQGKKLEALGNMTTALNNLPNLSKREKFLKNLTDIVMKISNR